MSSTVQITYIYFNVYTHTYIHVRTYILQKRAGGDIEDLPTHVQGLNKNMFVREASFRLQKTQIQIEQNLPSILATMSLISKPPISLPVALDRSARETNSSTSYDVENETAAVRAMLNESRLAFCTSPIRILGYKNGPRSLSMTVFSSNF